MKIARTTGITFLTVAGLAVSLLGSPAVAGTVTINRPFTLSSGGSSGALAGTQFGFQAFDPTL